MELLSVNVAQLRAIRVGAREVMTGIDKRSVTGPVRVRRHNLAGDAQADLRVHGGEYKAVYAYPFEHYAAWERELGRRDLAPGAFGENLTISGATEERVCIGDVLRIGTAVLQVTHPRTPCFKLAHKFERPQFPQEFLASGRSGYYLRIVEEGELRAGDAIEFVHRDPQQVSVRALLGLTDLNEINPALAARALHADGLPSSWREDVAALLEK
jgi:MOSC domain-containing protein YiiM